MAKKLALAKDTFSKMLKGTEQGFTSKFNTMVGKTVRELNPDLSASQVRKIRGGINDFLDEGTAKSLFNFTRDGDEKAFSELLKKRIEKPRLDGVSSPDWLSRSTGAAKGASSTVESVERTISEAAEGATKKSNTVQDYASRRYAKQQEAYQKAREQDLSSIGSGDKKNIDQLYKRLGHDPSKEIGPKKLTRDVNKFYDKKIESLDNTPNYSDYLGHYKIPEKGTALVGTAYLVNNLARSKGKQTNAELYGQAPRR